MASESLRGVSNGRVLQKPYRGFSPLVFDLLPALASTVSSCRSALATRAQIRDLRIDSGGPLLWSASVTDDFGNLDNLGRGVSDQEKESVGVALSCGVEGILRRCLSPRLLKLSRLSVTSFGVGCSGRISQGASESTAASTQRTCKYEGAQKSAALSTLSSMTEPVI